MLTLHENARLSRRELLRIGGLALGGLSLSSLLAARATAAPSTVTGKSVIFLFQQGPALGPIARLGEVSPIPGLS